jgi:hypothetical protein
MAIASRRGRCCCTPIAALIWLPGDRTAAAVPMVGTSMSRVIAIAACGILLAACSMSMPSLDFFRATPATEVLRIESEPPGADARTAEGQSCRTPCELTVPSAGEVAISFALQGYNPQTINVRAEAPATTSFAEGAPPARMQPNPVYAELAPAGPPRQKKKAPAKKKVAKKAAPDAESEPTASVGAAPKQTAQDPGSSYPSNYPWPPPPPAQ